jgi:hypothetical protein
MSELLGPSLFSALNLFGLVVSTVDLLNGRSKALLLTIMLVESFSLCLGIAWIVRRAVRVPSSNELAGVPPQEHRKVGDFRGKTGTDGP